MSGSMAASPMAAGPLVDGVIVDRAKILLVDDRQENLLALEAILSSLDQTLVRARSGEEALKALLHDDYALILLDVQMPGMDGYETAEHIKRRERTKDVPIIFLTAIDKEPHHAFRGYSAGAADFLAKPFDPWVLRAKVSVFVDLDAKTRLLRRQAELLRAGRGGAPAGQRLLDELPPRLDLLDRQVQALRASLSGPPEPAVAGALGELESTVASLRAWLPAPRSG